MAETTRLSRAAYTALADRGLIRAVKNDCTSSMTCAISRPDVSIGSPSYAQGSYWYGCLPTMREDWFRRLMDAYVQVLGEHEEMAQVLAVI